MARRFTAESNRRIEERRRKKRLEHKWPILVASLRLDVVLQERIKESARRNRRKPYQEALAALEWYYLEMWGEK